MYALNFKERDEETVTLAGSTKTTVRWLIGRNTGAKTYAMRHFEVQPGGMIPLHTHPEEHQIFILQGEAKMFGTDTNQVVKKDDVVFIPSKEEHGYDNREGTEPFRFICVIPLIEKD
ncbi:MAG: cupin domain-containing protein [Candidatus Hodarchaeota archaeon]